MDFLTLYKVDVIEFFRGFKGWNLFWTLFNALPLHSRVKAKMMSNKEVAEYEVSQLSDEDIEKMVKKDEEEDDSEPNIPFEGYDPVVRKLDDVLDQLIFNRETLIRAFSKKAGSKKIKFTPRPKTEYDKLLEQRKLRWERDQNYDVMGRLGF